MKRAVSLVGVFALDWNSTETDGISGLPPHWLRAGSSWRWQGQARCLDGHADLLRLGLADGDCDIRARARPVAARLGGTILPADTASTQPPTPAMGFVLTDGVTLFSARLVQTAGGQWIAAFANSLPPQGQLLYVVENAVALDEDHPPTDARTQQQDVICFADDTLIATPQGARPIHQLKAGDLVLTQDNGPQPVIWIGTSRICGMAMRRYPRLRPIRLRGGMLGIGQPDEDLRVSPAHRLLMRGARARALFNLDEVLVRACDLLDHPGVTQDVALHGATYMHLLLEHHQIIFANNLPTESFHPAFAAPAVLRPHRAALRAVFSGLDDGNGAYYGDTARRYLGTAETALLAA